MKMRMRWSLWLRGLLAFMMAVCCVSCAKSVEALWQEQYDLGVRYLSESNYEEAIIAFTSAIEIEPNKADAFVGRGDAYAALARQESDSNIAQTLWEKAYLDYAQARELGDTQAGEKQEESRDVLQQLQEELEENRAIQQQLQEEQATQLLLEALYVKFANGDIEAAESLMQQSDYLELSKSVPGTSCYYDHGDGTGVAVYP